jgi:hypothetical protein
MTAAAAAMGKAAASLNDLKTAPALPHEMEALDHLLRAQADVKKRQGGAQQTASGNGANRSNVDVSTRFDKELQRQDRTNYETHKSEGDREGDTALDRIKDLAKRQDELAERQQQVAQSRNQLAPEELKHQLETLAREQADLRQQAEEIARDTPQQGPQMRAASEAMRGATNDLRQQDPGRAAQQGAQAAGALRDLEQQLESRNPPDNSGQKGNGPADEESKKLAGERARAEELRDKLDQLMSRLEKASESGKAPKGPGPTKAELDQIQQDYQRQLQQASQFLDQLRREDASVAQGGSGFTFEGQGMTLSAPGTEAFKQDFGKWMALRQQATDALERAEDSIAKRQLAKDSRTRLASGVEDKAPAGYEHQVDSYFKALATKKKP